MEKVNVTIQSRIADLLNKDRVKMVDFTKGQFDAIKRKKLRMPIELYQL
ncbi:hypothetical protein KBD09_00595 [Candidatus Woesebacteria bacterium]|jgi:hypothetical protein|nr:hypothetical protein [Candidatus Woesebacteria bacterium]